MEILYRLSNESDPEAKYRCIPGTDRARELINQVNDLNKDKNSKQFHHYSFRYVTDRVMSAPGKGDFMGECNRTVCHDTPADYYNHSTQKYYCGPCANMINYPGGHADAMRLFGHDICTKVIYLPPAQTKDTSDTAAPTIENWTTPIDGIINVPDELDPLINSLGFQYRLCTISNRFGEAEMICRMAYAAQKFFYEMYVTKKEQSQSEKTDILLMHLKTVEYPAYGHQVIMFWITNGVYHAGLRNYKEAPVPDIDNKAHFKGNTPYAALFQLYAFCLKNKFVKPLPPEVVIPQ